ncbi:MAG: hypothetical protein HQ582_31695 [Planctomycetes bacterium]|nr:hypothetical protein [Planctomycetota bacterium]
MIALAGFAALVGLAFKNEPFRDPTLVTAARLFISISAGFAAAILPGQFGFNVFGANRRIQGAGALGIAAAVFFLAPYVTPALDPASIPTTAPLRLPVKVFTASDFSGAHDAEADQGMMRVMKSPAPLMAQLINTLNLLYYEEEQTLFVGVTEPFERPYDAFTSVLTIPDPAKTPCGAKLHHDILPFLVQRSEGATVYRPLLVLVSTSLDKQLVHVPRSEQGDRVVLLMSLHLPKAMSFRDIPASLDTLR